uniref:Uncharacterized protein n=1 Tax=Romanomermis culicivorax TaxID=13658 RepID=A0A915IYT1_ROMCU
MESFERIHKTRVTTGMSRSYCQNCDQRDQPLFKLFRTLSALLGAVGICIYISPCDPWYRVRAQGMEPKLMTDSGEGRGSLVSCMQSNQRSVS